VLQDAFNGPILDSVQALGNLLNNIVSNYDIIGESAVRGRRYDGRITFESMPTMHVLGTQRCGVPYVASLPDELFEQGRNRSRLRTP
jgi:hypothetical protein